jgi:HAMP domain-containing protein
MNKASMQRRVWENLSQLRVTYRTGPLGRQARKWFSGQGPLPGDRVPDIDCGRAEGGGQTTLHAELGNKWALVMPGRMVRDDYAAVVAKRLGDDGMITLVAAMTPTERSCWCVPTPISAGGPHGSRRSRPLDDRRGPAGSGAPR